MEAKFTKGEWHCVFGDVYSCVRIDGKVIADLRTVNCVYNRHDAYLIAAAPDMHEELLLARETLNNLWINTGSMGCQSRVKSIDKALAKARGEQ